MTGFTGAEAPQWAWPRAAQFAPSRAAARVTPSEAATLTRALQALADPARIQILSIIAANDPEPTNVTELVNCLSLAQSTVSHHVRVLVDAGYLARDRAGTHSRYRAIPESLAELAAALAPRGAHAPLEPAARDTR